MAAVTRIETRKRGFFGWLFKLIFILFNILMVVWLVSYWKSLGDMGSHRSDAWQEGLAIGGTIGTTALLFFWALGDIILGMLTFFTRGKMVMVETIE